MLSNRYIVFALGVAFALFLLPMIQGAFVSARTKPASERRV